MKKLIFALAFLGATSAFAYPSSSEMKENFATCTTQDSSWYQRFGQYVVSFDLGNASDICRAQSHNGGSYSEARAAACKINGSWAYAGFYCEDKGY